MYWYKFWHMMIENSKNISYRIIYIFVQQRFSRKFEFRASKLPSNSQILPLKSGRISGRIFCRFRSLYGRSLTFCRQNILPAEYSAGRMVLMNRPIKACCCWWPHCSLGRNENLFLDFCFQDWNPSSLICSQSPRLCCGDECL